MPTNIVVSDECAEHLDKLAPSYLKGNRKSAQRFEWAVERLSELLPANDKDNEPSPQPAAST